MVRVVGGGSSSKRRRIPAVAVVAGLLLAFRFRRSWAGLPSASSLVGSSPAAVVPGGIHHHDDHHRSDYAIAAASGANDGGSYYEIFWEKAFRAALETKRALASRAEDDGAFASSATPCPRVYVYNLSDAFTDLSRADTLRADDAFGAPVGGWNGTLRRTNQYALGRILEHRLRQPTSCYFTTDPGEADLFFVPVLTAPKKQQQWTKKCSWLNATALLEELAPTLTPENACRHFFALGKGHYVGKPCKGWFWDPLPAFSSTIRIAYSHFGKTKDPPEKASLKHPHLFSVPYPSSIHLEPGVPPPHGRHRDRKHLMGFVGSYDHGDLPVRRKIRDACLAYNSSQVCHPVAGRGTRAEDLLVKSDTTFCLEPGGDSPWRKSLSDSIAFGCIPVLFSNDTDNVAPWFWGDWKAAGRVLVDRDDFVAGRVDLLELLGSVPPGLLRLMRETLAGHARRYQYSLRDDPGDAVHVLLAAMRDHSRSMDRRGLCR